MCSCCSCHAPPWPEYLSIHLTWHTATAAIINLTPHPGHPTTTPVAVRAHVPANPQGRTPFTQARRGISGRAAVAIAGTRERLLHGTSSSQRAEPPTVSCVPVLQWHNRTTGLGPAAYRRRSCRLIGRWQVRGAPTYAGTLPFSWQRSFDPHRPDGSLAPIRGETHAPAHDWAGRAHHHHAVDS